MPVTPPTSRGSSSGGGFDPSTSWLEAGGTLSELTPADGTDELVPWIRTDGAGTDIAVNAGDNTTINVLTSGVYYVTVYFSPFSTAADTTEGLFNGYSVETFDFVNQRLAYVQNAQVGQQNWQSTSEMRALVAPHAMQFAMDLTANGTTPKLAGGARIFVQRVL